MDGLVYQGKGHGYPEQGQSYQDQGQSYQDQGQSYQEQGQSYHGQGQEPENYQGHTSAGYPNQAMGPAYQNLRPSPVYETVPGSFVAGASRPSFPSGQEEGGGYSETEGQYSPLPSEGGFPSSKQVTK